jgi:hypothetical protein
MGHSQESFSELVAEIKSLGYDDATAGRWAAFIGDTPIGDDQGRIVVRDEQGKELARLRLKCFEEE